MSGWIKLHRQLQDNPLWKAEPFSRGQAWVDLLMLANHKAGHYRVRGVRIDVPRGSVGWAKAKLAERWKWSKGKLNRFLKELESDHQVVLQTDLPVTLISICNYDKFNPTEKDDGSLNEPPSEPLDGSPNGPQTGHQTGHKQECKEGKNEKKDITAGGILSIEQWLSDQGVNTQIGIGHSRSEYTKWIAAGITSDEIIQAFNDSVLTLEAQGQMKPPSVNYITAVIESNRSKSTSRKAGKGKPDNHSGFSERDYTSEKATGGFKVAGGASS